MFEQVDKEYYEVYTRVQKKREEEEAERNIEEEKFKEQNSKKDNL